MSGASSWTKVELDDVLTPDVIAGYALLHAQIAALQAEADALVAPLHARLVTAPVFQFVQTMRLFPEDSKVHSDLHNFFLGRMYSGPDHECE